MKNATVALQEIFAHRDHITDSRLCELHIVAHLRDLKSCPVSRCLLTRTQLDIGLVELGLGGT